MQQAVDLHETSAAPLGSFPAIFSQAMSLGLLSKRRVYQEAMQVLRSEQGSLRSLLGKSFLSIPMRELATCNLENTYGRKPCWWVR